MVRRLQVVFGLAVLVAVAFAAASAGQGPPGGSPPGLDKAIAAKEKHAQKLLDKPGVAGVGVTLNRGGKPVVEIYKERDDVADLPSDLDGVPVESVTTGMIKPRSLPTDRFARPVPIGVSGGLAGVATGTLGVRVTDGTNVYVLSNNHVLAGVNTGSIGDPIIQPGDADGGSDPGDRIATLAAYQTIDFNGGLNTMDAAIALSSTANFATATPEDGYGDPSAVTTPAFIGQGVQKYGRTTGLQLGDVAATDVSVDVCYIAFGDFCFQEARFAGQFTISPGPFSAPGDSGSLIVTQGTNQPVGLLFAGGDGLTVASPIDPILQRFGVTIDGAPPGDGPPGAPRTFAALAGAGSVSLSWTAPAFDGGSPITNYKVYRSTSTGTESFLANAGGSTTFVDTGLTNGTAYYYKVSAENANGEGALSNEASATPTDLVLPSEPLVTTDAFNRSENPLSDAGRWTNGVAGTSETGLSTTANTLACSKTTTCTAWRNNTQYGPDTEVWATMSTLPGVNNQIRMYARVLQPGTSGYDGYMLRPNQLAGTDEVYLERVDNGTIVRRLTMTQELAAGDRLLLRVKGSTLEAWRNDGTSWSRLGVVQDTTYASAGVAGVGIRGTTGRVDDFGVRSLSQNPPSVPTALAALAGAGSVSLSWTAPAFDGGSPITNYKVYRSTSTGTESFLANAGGSTTFVDTGLTNGTAYYYKVSAENANGEGALSNEASATPTDLVLPSEPLVTTDAFNRSENPLSDAGRWTNGVAGTSETGLSTTANTLACSKTTTCTAWRNNTQYGPDTEVWATMSTLPGVNNQIRMYARVLQPGTSGYDGYMLRPNQLAGTDEVYLERVDNGTIVRRLTMTQELAAGDRLLLRVKGSTLEAWRNDGTSWSRLGVVQDTTYASAGVAGVGIRGTTGRVDDFGVRTYGQTTSAPSAPQSLQATAGNAQVSLAWSAPSSNGGSPITSYTVYRGTAPNPTGALAAGVSTTSYLDSTAVNGTAYYYRVTASNSVAEGPYSNEVSATPSAPATAPSAPQSLQATAGNALVSLAWSAPSSNGGSPITSYTVYRSTTSGVLGSALTPGPGLSASYADTSAVNGSTYYYVVKASNVVGESLASNEASATPAAPATAPSAPQSLQATPGYAQVSLAWSAPSSNGGSPITSYTVYRGTAPNPTGALAAGVSTTSYLDSTAVNGTAYYYRVTASNSVAEGPYSNEVSATPADFPPPLEPLAILDPFNRGNESPLSDGGRWTNGLNGSGETGLRVTSNVLACTRTTTCTAWRNNATYGPDVEVSAVVATLPGNNNQFRLLARIQQPGTSGCDGYMLRSNQTSGTDQVFLERIDNGTIVGLRTMSKELVVGDVLLLRVKGSTLEAWHRGGTTWTKLGAVSDSHYAASGFVGVGIRAKTGRLDDFGAR